MESLRTAGERLGKNELEKRHAIEMEDYERARHKKQQMEQFRSEVYKQLRIEELLESEGVRYLFVTPLRFRRVVLGLRSKR